MTKKHTDEPQRSSLGVDIRYTEQGDADHLKQWLLDPSVNRWFPMLDEVEIDDAVMRWIGFHRYRCSLTATLNGKPVGLITLYLQPYKKLAHQCEFGIIVSPDHRGKKVGSELLSNLIHLAKTKFRIELLHLQVYADNPAIRLYKRFGFKEFGRQEKWIKETNGEYTARVFMEREI
ncbi:MAG: GNAT family N-acetyltransferase [Chlamydiales bacterium]|nr:GNAT family N-acetyltransferase [Chlamydiia bacterium]MCP5508552.1 GNAT family N-acetyltransferase [Chlamydiales bacterium]